jgi:glycosyltransferase involved in cell wall biosynthesis
MIVSVIIPCYNVGRHLEKVVAHLPAAIDHIIIVNDRSPDDVESVILRLQKENKKIIYLKHDVNQGVGGAMLTGFKKSLELNCDITIKMDGDDQMDPSYIPALLQPLIENRADFTKGNRFRDLNALKSMPLGRRIGNLGLSFLIKGASGYWNIFDPTNGYFAIKNDVLQSFNFKQIHKRYFFESSMLIELYHVGAVVQDVPMKARYGDEVSGLSKTKTLFEFPPKLILAFFRRIILKYFLYEFNIASLYLLSGFPLFIFGIMFGIVKYIKYTSMNLPAPTGTVVIPTMLIILGFQLLLAAANYDINNYPKR